VNRPRMTSIRACIVALCVAITTIATGCGEKQESTTPGQPDSLSLVLDWVVNADHAGIYEALDRGYFREAGLDVKPEVPSDPSAPIKEVAAGRADLAISYEPEVLLAHDQGLPVKAIAAIVPQPLTSMIWLPDSGIKDVRGLRGKTVATAGIPYQSDYLKAILERAHLAPNDVDEVNVQANLLPAILSGRADAILGGFSNVEGVDLTLRGKDPTVIPVDRLGIPPYDELVLVATTDEVENDPQTLRVFISALERGTEAAVKDPAGATAALLDAGHGLDPKLTRAEVDKTLPLLEQRDNRSYGYMDPKEWQRFAHFFADHGLIEALPSPDDVLTNDLLPGNLPD
jgi:putative hydroxymethylpyrimidine transport system substrate-binding protein